MFETCPACGRYSQDMRPEGDKLVCPNCGHGAPFVRRPIFYLTGASGAGKSTAARVLFDTEKRFLTLECDILWHERFDTPENGYADFRDSWLRLAANAAQYGKSSLLCGCVIPEQIESRPRRGYFSNVYFAAITLKCEELERRMDLRGFAPDQRKSSRDFNNWLIENGAEQGIYVIDATEHTPEMTASAISDFVCALLRLSHA